MIECEGPAASCEKTGIRQPGSDRLVKIAVPSGAINHDQTRHRTATLGHTSWQVRCDIGGFRSDSQADSAGMAEAAQVPSADVTPTLRNCVDQAFVPEYGQRAARG